MPPPLTRAGGRRVGDLVGQLPADVLLRIFRRLPKQELQDAALVCKRWLAVAHEPSGLFRRVVVDLTREAAPLQPSFAEWLADRAAFIHLLKLNLKRRMTAKAAAAVHAIGGAGVEPRLQDLRVDFGGGSSKAAGGLLAALAAEPRVASKLGQLVMSEMRGELQHAHLADTLQLPALMSCLIRFSDMECEAPDQDWLPDGLPPALFTCRRLEFLGVHAAGVASLRQLPDELSQLQRLKRLSLAGCGLQEFPAGLTELTCLIELSVAPSQPPEAIGLPASLAALTRLTNVHMGCRTVPLELSSLRNLKALFLYALQHGPDLEQRLEQLLDSQRLEVLALRQCELLRLPPAAARQTGLRRLDLYGCEELEDLPKGPYLQQLEHLNLMFSVDSMPAALWEAPRLHTLAIGDQPPMELPLEDSLRPAALARIGDELQQRIAALEAEFDEMEQAGEADE